MNTWLPAGRELLIYDKSCEASAEYWTICWTERRNGS